MPSRKKAKGKARKAAKEAKAKEEESRDRAVEVVAKQRRERSLEFQLQRLMLNDTPQKCRHGLLPLSAGEREICLEFIDAFITGLFSQGDVAEGFYAATGATVERYADVYSSKLGTVMSIFLCSGTQRLLDDGDNVGVRLYASIACYFEEWIAVNVHKNQATLRWAKLVELESADDHTLVSYYRKRIPCACLDEKYKEVKSVKKMGLCYNPNCSHPRGRVERSKMFSCTRCGDGNYCSVECQKADWKDHREECNKEAKKKAAFDSEQA